MSLTKEVTVESIALEMGDAPFGSNLKNTDYTESGALVVQGKNIQGRVFDWSDKRHVSIEKYTSIPRSHCFVGDLLFPKVGTIGKVGILSPCDGYEQYLLSTNTMRLKVDPAKADPYFIYYYFTWSKTVNLIQAMNSKSVQPVFNYTSLKKFPLQLPVLSTQTLAARILKGIDDKIILNTQTNQTLEEMAQAIFKSWFVDFDPVKAKMNGEQPEGMDEATASLFPEKLVESELGLIPEGWDVLPSEKVATVAIGKTPPRKEPQWFSEDSKDVTWISIRDMGNAGTFALDSSEYLTQEAVDKFNVKVIPDNTLILSFKLTVGRVAITHGEMTTNEAIAHYKLSDNARVSTNYLYSYMKQFNFESLGSTSSIAKAVNSKIIKALPVIVPSKEILGSFDRLVKPLFDKIKSNQIENQNLEDLRDTLLPKLLSGEIELGETEEMAEVN